MTPDYYRGRVTLRGGDVFMQVFRKRDGALMYEDNSGAKAWPQFVVDCHNEVTAHNLLSTHGHQLRTWPQLLEDARGAF